MGRPFSVWVSVWSALAKCAYLRSLGYCPESDEKPNGTVYICDDRMLHVVTVCYRQMADDDGPGIGDSGNPGSLQVCR